MITSVQLIICSIGRVITASNLYKISTKIFSTIKSITMSRTNQISSKQYTKSLAYNNKQQTGLRSSINGLSSICHLWGKVPIMGSFRSRMIELTAPKSNTQTAKVPATDVLETTPWCFHKRIKSSISIFQRRSHKSNSTTPICTHPKPNVTRQWIKA